MNGVPNFIPAGQKDLTLYSEAGKPYTVSVSDEGALQVKNETTGETAGVGGGGIATAIWKDSSYDNALMGVAAAESVAYPEFSPVNMTYDDAMEIIMSGKPLMVVGMSADFGSMAILFSTRISPSNVNGRIEVDLSSITFYWLSNNTITTELPR